MEIFVLAVLFALIWALFCSLLMFSMERNGILCTLREQLFAYSGDSTLAEVQEFLGHNKWFDTIQEKEEYYYEQLARLAEDSLFRKALTCNVCFSVHTGVYAGVIAAAMYVTHGNIGDADQLSVMGCFSVISILFTYLFSQKV